MTRYLICFTLSALLFASIGCGDEQLPPIQPDVPIASDTVITDVSADTTPAPADTTVTDTKTPDTQVPPKDTAAPDVPPVQDTGTAPDTTPDDTPPTIVASSPAAGQAGVAIPFTVTVTFSEPIASNTIAPQTFKVFDPAGDELKGTIGVSGDKLKATFTVTTPVEEIQPASPYSVWLSGGIISDLAGNKLQDNHTFSFSTADYGDMAAYQALASKYSPRIHTITDPDIGTSHTQIPVAFNADGDWDGSNNYKWIKKDATSLVPSVYYDVVETQSHFFIHYFLFFPWVNDANTLYEHANGANGVMVVVKKAHGEVAEHPVAVTTVFKKGQYEEHYAYVTNESGIQGPKGLGFYLLKGSYPEATLFANGHPEIFITAGKHEACLLLEKGLSGACEYEAPYTLVLAHDGSPATTITKGEQGWPKDLSEIEGTPEALHYGLNSLTATLWARRDAVTPDGIWGGTFKYDTEIDTIGWGLTVPSQFIDPIEELDAAFGRPVWAWRFNPSQGSVPSIKHGQIGIDPAGYFMKMHGSVDKDTALVDFNAETGTGFSTTYCFNPFVHIDRRQEPDCVAAGSE